MEKVKTVTMKLTCGPVTDHIGGVKSYTQGEKTTDYIQKNIVMNAVYGKPEDNNFANATPTGKMEFSLSNPKADIFVPGKQYRVTIEEWVD
jgi:mRNA degradation ribonuclease J1/J2